MDTIFQRVSLPDGRQVGPARIVVRVLASEDNRPSPIRVGVWRQRQGMISREYVGDVTGEIESSVGAFQVARSSQSATITTTDGTVSASGLGCNCGTLPYATIPDVF